MIIDEYSESVLNSSLLAARVDGDGFLRTIEYYKNDKIVIQKGTGASSETKNNACIPIAIYSFDEKGI